MTLSKDTNMTPLEIARQRIREDIASKNDSAKRLRKSKAIAVRNKRMVTATNKAHRQLALLYPEDYEALRTTAFDLLGSDDRYTLPDEELETVSPAWRNVNPA